MNNYNDNDTDNIDYDNKGLKLKGPSKELGRLIEMHLKHKFRMFIIRIVCLSVLSITMSGFLPLSNLINIIFPKTQSNKPFKLEPNYNYPTKSSDSNKHYKEFAKNKKISYYKSYFSDLLS